MNLLQFSANQELNLTDIPPKKNYNESPVDKIVVSPNTGGGPISSKVFFQKFWRYGPSK